MAKDVLRDSKILVNSVDLSDHMDNFNLSDEAEDVDLTAFGQGYRETAQGLKTASITASFFNDHAAASVADTLQPLYASGGTFPVKVWPSAAGTVVYTMTARLFQRPMAGGGVGEASKIEVTFNNAGTLGITRGTS